MRFTWSLWSLIWLPQARKWPFWRQVACSRHFFARAGNCRFYLIFGQKCPKMGKIAILGLCLVTKRSEFLAPRSARPMALLGHFLGGHFGHFGLFIQNRPFLAHFGPFWSPDPLLGHKKERFFGLGGQTSWPSIVCSCVHFGGNCFNACRYRPMWQCVHFRGNCFSACSC